MQSSSRTTNGDPHVVCAALAPGGCAGGSTRGGASCFQDQDHPDPVYVRWAAPRHPTPLDACGPARVSRSAAAHGDDPILRPRAHPSRSITPSYQVLLGYRPRADPCALRRRIPESPETIRQVTTCQRVCRPSGDRRPVCMTYDAAQCYNPFSDRLGRSGGATRIWSGTHTRFVRSVMDGGTRGTMGTLFQSAQHNLRAALSSETWYRPVVK